MLKLMTLFFELFEVLHIVLATYEITSKNNHKIPKYMRVLMLAILVANWFMENWID